MKFTKIRLVGLYTTELAKENALPSDPYILKGADGLGPPEIDVMLAETVVGDPIYQGSKPQNREPVIRIGLNPDHGVGQTAAEMRTSLYGLLTPGPTGSITMELVDGDTVVATTPGYAKRLEIAPFSDTPEVQLTMACIRPYLDAPNVLYVTPGGSQSAPELINAGTAPTGFRMEVLLNEAMPGWSIFDAVGKKMEFDYDFVANDKLAFDTRPGSRGVWLTRDLLTSSILHALVSGSSWLNLHGGVNRFTTSSPAFEWGDVYFRPQYWGV